MLTSETLLYAAAGLAMSAVGDAMVRGLRTAWKCACAVCVCVCVCDPVIMHYVLSSE